MPYMRVASARALPPPRDQHDWIEDNETPAFSTYQYRRVHLLGQTFYLGECEAWTTRPGAHPAEQLVAKLFEGYHVAPAA